MQFHFCPKIRVFVLLGHIARRKFTVPTIVLHDKKHVSPIPVPVSNGEGLCVPRQGRFRCRFVRQCMLLLRCWSLCHLLVSEQQKNCEVLDKEQPVTEFVLMSLVCSGIQNLGWGIGIRALGQGELQLEKGARNGGGRPIVPLRSCFTECPKMSKYTENMDLQFQPPAPKVSKKTRRFLDQATECTHVTYFQQRRVSDDRKSFRCGPLQSDVSRCNIGTHRRPLYSRGRCWAFRWGTDENDPEKTKQAKRDKLEIPINFSSTTTKSKVSLQH